MATTQKQTHGPIRTRDNNDIKGQVERFVKTVSDLQSILTQETDCLNNANREGFFRLQEKKVNIASIYKDEVLALKKLATELKEKYPELVPFLQNKQQELNTHVQENVKALKRMEKATTRLTDRIMEIARQAATEQSAVSYGAQGRFDENKRASIGISESA
jgi:hypothetical protein